MAIDLKKTQLGVQPQVLAGLLGLDADSNMSFKELDRLISADQNISALVMKAANSSFYSRGQPITKLHQAIGRLGFGVVRSMAIAASSTQMFEKGRYARFRRFVSEHCMVTGLIARQLAQKTGQREIAEEAFVSGLLHDISKAVMNAHNREAFILTLDLIEQEKADCVEAEQRVFGFDHHQIGALVCDEWKLPQIFKAALTDHEGLASIKREDRTEKEVQLLALVGYANVVAHRIGYGGGVSDLAAEANLYSQELKLSPELIEYYNGPVLDTLKNDEHFRFFMTLV